MFDTGFFYGKIVSSYAAQAIGLNRTDFSLET